MECFGCVALLDISKHCSNGLEDIWAGSCC